MAKRMLADVLWEAANKRLCPDPSEYPVTQEEESCFAAKLAYYGDGIWKSGADIEPIIFLTSLGCQYYGGPLSEFRHGEERQGVRYMWLLLAMHVAEDEGLTA